MNVLLLITIIVSLIGIKIHVSDNNFDHYLKKEHTNVVNGIFVMFVLMRHIKFYIERSAADEVFWKVDGFLGQVIVTTFLFYSGYGIVVSLLNKKDYGRRLPVRIFRVWFQFACGVSLYLLLGIVQKRHFGLVKILHSYVAWDGIGNSNWYILTILFVYFITFVGYLIFRNKTLGIIACVVAGCAAYILILHEVGKGSYYYDTIMCYPLGMAFGYYKKYIDAVLRHTMAWLGCMALLLGSYVICYHYMRTTVGFMNYLAYEANSVIFVLIVVLITVKVEFGNRILSWLGNYTFEIYILQRLPMIILKPIVSMHYLYLFLSVGIVLCIVPVFRKGTGYLEHLIIRT